MRPSLFGFCLVAAIPCLLSFVQLHNPNPGALKTLLLMAILSDGARVLSVRSAGRFFSFAFLLARLCSDEGGVTEQFSRPVSGMTLSWPSKCTLAF